MPLSSKPPARSGRLIKLGLWAVTVALGLAACGPSPAEPTPPDAVRPGLSSVTQPSGPTPAFLPVEEPPAGAQAEFTTDFSRHLVPYSEILSGGPPKGGIDEDRGIPALADPRFVSVAEADTWLKPVEPVIVLQIDDDARAYPLQILIWHEIVNDTVGGVPVLVTFCPLCNTAIAFERSVNGQATEFGTTGRLRFSNLIMYDRLTETWWQQATGQAIAGALAGQQLAIRPAAIIAWADFRAAHPAGRVLARETGFDRAYGQNPYVGYDDVNQPPFLYRGPATPGQMPAVARVLTLELAGEAVAYPYDTLQAVKVVNDNVRGTAVAVFWAAGTASALDSATVAGGRDVGAAMAFARDLDDRQLTFRLVGERIVDVETGSEWNELGQAVAGPLGGQRLAPLPAINHFWFSWAAFRPQTRIFQP